MKNGNLFRFTIKALLLIGTVVAFLVPGCNTGELKDQVMILSEKQTFLAGERDSLQQLLDVITSKVDATNKDYITLSSDFKTLTTKNKSLQSGYNSRGERLKKVTEENAEMKNSADYQIQKNDSLQNELKYLQEKIAAIDKAMADAQRDNTTLTETVRQQEEKIVADSIAEASKPAPPLKESGFISITEVGVGFGLGDVSVLNSKSLFSFTTIAAHRVNSHFLAGIGAGVHIYDGGTLMPVFIDVRYTFKQRNFTPFISSDGGVLLYFKEINTSGLFISPAIGLEKKLSERVSLNLSTGLLIKQPLKASFITFKGGVNFRGK